MNILYLSAHSILEYDELRLFEGLGYDYFSIGAYINPATPHDPKRPPLKGKFHEHLASVAMVHNADNLHEEQVSWADVVIVMHLPQWIENNWALFKRLNKRVIWRSIGQSVEGIEQRLQPYRAEGLEVVRYSPAEVKIPNSIGSDAIIRFYKDPKEFGDWNGDSEEVITFSQSMRGRGKFCNFDAFAAVNNGLNAHVYGPNNDDTGELNGGLLAYDDLKAKMRDSRVYFYGGTHPASYTLNFIEAFMTGIPIVAVGPILGNSDDFPQDTYEIPEIITNGVHGFYSNSLEELRQFTDALLNDHAFAKQISRQARQRAIDLFDMAMIKKQWRTYLEEGPKK
jgi:glycosyltransferase involved in cell wall biosynthesis